MTLRTISNDLGKGGARVAQDLKGILQELQGLKVTVLPAGEAAGTKMNIAALRKEDTILVARANVTSSGAVSDDTTNVTIQETHASGTLTVASVNNADTCVVNGVTYTFKNTPTAATHVKRTAGDNNANARRTGRCYQCL